MVQHRQPQGQQEGITAGAAAWYATAITATAAASSPSSAAAVSTNRFANGNGQSQLEGERGEQERGTSWQQLYNSWLPRAETDNNGQERCSCKASAQQRVAALG